MASYNFIRVGVCFIFMGLVACGGGSSSSEEDNGKAVDPQTLSFAVSDFSSHIEFSEDNQFIRLKLSFFPDDSQFDFNQKRITLPCFFGQSLPDGVSADLSVPQDPEACEPIVVAVLHTGETMNVDGIVVRADRNLFVEELGIQITPQGVKNLANEMMLMANRGKLAEYYELANREIDLN